MSPLAQINYLVDNVFLKESRRTYEDSLQASADCEVSVNHCLDYVGRQAVIRNGLPWASVVLCPGVIRSAYDSPLEFPNPGRPGNRALWALLDAITSRASRRIARHMEGLDGNRRAMSLLAVESPFLNFVAASKYIGATHPDLPGNFVHTGAWEQQEDAVPDVSPELAEFIRGGAPDVVFTFGSMGGQEGRQTARIFLEAIERAGVRAVIQKGWGNIETEQAHTNVFFAEYVPHNYLFEKCKIVVHHGGAGTTQSACRAGCNSMIVPHLADQFYWGRTLFKLGVATRPVPRKRLSSRKVARGIRDLLDDSRYAENARALAQRIQAEDGPAAAVTALEQKLKGGSSGNFMGRATNHPNGRE